VDADVLDAVLHAWLARARPATTSAGSVSCGGRGRQELKDGYRTPPGEATLPPQCPGWDLVDQRGFKVA